MNRGLQSGAIQAPSDPRCKVSKWKGSVKERKYHVLDLISGTIEYVIFNSSVHNGERAVLERIYFVKNKQTGLYQAPPRPASLNAVFRELSPATRLLVRRIKKTTPYSHREFPGLYIGRKKTIYTNAYNKWLDTGYLKKYSYISSFLKCEGYDATKKHVNDIVNRVVSPAHPIHNLCVGRFTKRIEHGLYHNIDEMFNIYTNLPRVNTIMKGLNASEMGVQFKKIWDSFDNPIAIGLDASRFDQHVSKEMLKWEHSIYARHFSGSEQQELRRLLALQLKSKCFMRFPDGDIKYTVDGTRCSGHMNTGLGNCLIMCSAVFSFMHSLHIKKYRLANNGDDCVLFLEKRDQNRVTQQAISDWFTAIGFTMEIEPTVDVLEKVVFCQMQPIFDGSDYIMMRDPRVTVSKDALNIKPFDGPKDYCSWIDAVGTGGCALTGGLPVAQNYYQALRYSAQRMVKDNVTKHKKRAHNQMEENGLWMLSKGMNRATKSPTDDARFSFWLAFNITPDVQCMIERYFDSVYLLWEGSQKIGFVNRFIFH